LRNSASNDAIIEALLKKPRRFISGEDLGAAAGITRAALWKRMEALRNKGFKIQAVRGRGYKLVSCPDFSSEVLRARVHGELGRTATLVQGVDSTNDVAMERALRGDPHGTVVMADEQRRGKGRLGRIWVSPPDANIYMSVILRPEMSPGDAGLLTIMAAVASASSLQEMTGLEVTIKWPNDIEVSGRKLGGILTEMRSEPGRVLCAVVGIGINVNMRMDDFPEELRDTATSLYHETGRAWARTDVAAHLLDGLHGEIVSLRKHGRRPLLDRWRRLSSTLGEKVSVETSAGTIAGTALDVDDRGLLLVRTARGIQTVSSGDVTMLRGT
jgi:BirA family biotin operon repressor/biotin-[acetyl-CoA-carboxylase] ligase